VVIGLIGACVRKMRFINARFFLASTPRTSWWAQSASFELVSDTHVSQILVFLRLESYVYHLDAAVGARTSHTRAHASVGAHAVNVIMKERSSWL